MSRGLAFYWTLAVTASDVAGGASAVVRVGDPDRSARPDPALPPPAQRVSLRVDTEDSEHGAGSPAALEALSRCAGRLLIREHSHRILRYARAQIRALESRAAHDLRALLQPLTLHVSELRRGSPSADDIELLDDLTRSLVEWVEENLQDGALAARGRGAAAPSTEGADLGTVLEEVRSRDDGRTPADGVRGRLPELDVDRPSLEAGLSELFRIPAEPGGGTLDLGREEDGLVRIGLVLEDETRPLEGLRPPGASSDEEEYPPVVGGLLNLTAWTGGALRVEAGSHVRRRIDVRLPAADPSGPG